MYHGMLTVYKEAGYTSSDAVARLRGILRMRKIGHTGTLDPDAEGVLPMCLGNATRICELIADREKEYLAVMRLGVRTDTQDMSGAVLSRIEDDELLRLLCGEDASRKQHPGEERPTPEEPAAEKESFGEAAAEIADKRIRDVAACFTGEIDQIPPMYSAVKINGKRLYDLARKGKTVERKARRITIFSLDIEKIDIPLVTMRVRCSKGTYIRTLCEDIGEALGTGAAMQSLLRTRVGQFTLGEARTLDEIEHIARTEPEQALRALIRPVDSFFEELMPAVCRQKALRLLKNGNPLTDDDLKLPEMDFSLADTDRMILGNGNQPYTVLRVYDEAGRFYGLYKKEKGSRHYTAYKMFLPDPV